MTINVFIADDHDVVRQGLKHMLSLPAGFSVIGEASDGRQAVDLVTRLNPDVVIMDIAMPEMNGIEATQQICAALPAVGVIILSMFCTNEHIFRAFQAGAKGYLLKESAGKEVGKAIIAVKAGQYFLSERISAAVIDDYRLKYFKLPEKSPLERLTSREREVLQLVVEGKSSMEIAHMLSLSSKTVETYRSRLMQKLKVSSLPGLIRFAIQNGLTTVSKYFPSG